MVVSQLHEFIATLSTLHDPMDADSIWFLSEAKHFPASAVQEETARYTGPTAASFDRWSYSKTNGRSFVHDIGQINPQNFLPRSYNKNHSSTGVKLEWVAVVQARDRISKSVFMVLTLRRPSSDDDEEEDGTHREPAHLAAEARNAAGTYLDVVLSRAT
jgi:hypothetical protein